jgi:hypothetical protein
MFGLEEAMKKDMFKGVSQKALIPCKQYKWTCDDSENN